MRTFGNRVRQNKKPRLFRRGWRWSTKYLTLLLSSFSFRRSDTCAEIPTGRRCVASIGVADFARNIVKEIVSNLEEERWKNLQRRKYVGRKKTRARVEREPLHSLVKVSEWWPRLPKSSRSPCHHRPPRLPRSSTSCRFAHCYPCR